MDPQIFTAPEGQEIRVLMNNGEPWFIARDVCAALEIVNGRDAVGKLSADEKGVGITDTLGGAQRIAIVSESGLYALVFSSRKPEARAFQRWVTHDVLPSIRKSGGYQLAPTSRLELARMLLEAEEKAEATAKALEAAQPAIEFFEATAAADEETGYQETAKLLEVNHHAFMRYLKEEKIVRSLGGKSLPMHYPISMGYMVERTTFSGHLQGFFTDKGRKWIKSKTDHLPRIAPRLELVA